jgi:hypothetical protein
MKRVVLQTGLHESDIRPQGMLDEFRRISLRNAGAYFPPAVLVDVDCPACGGENTHAAFHRDGFGYRACESCGTLYMTPRPPAALLAAYHRDSEASRFRAEGFGSQTGAARKRHLYESLADWMARLAVKHGGHAGGCYADAGTSAAGLLEAVRETGCFETLGAIDPMPGATEPCARAGFTVFESDPEGLAAVSAFSQLERQFAPEAFLQRLAAMVAPGGIVFLTTRSASGFDLQALWERDPAIIVPEHLNLPTVEGMRALVERAGLRIMELSTPGQLDVEAVERAAQAGGALPRFVHYMLTQRGQAAREDFQAFLQRHHLSSHLRVAAVKPGSPSS